MKNHIWVILLLFSTLLLACQPIVEIKQKPETVIETYGYEEDIPTFQDAEIDQLGLINNRFGVFRLNDGGRICYIVVDSGSNKLSTTTPPAISCR